MTKIMLANEKCTAPKAGTSAIFPSYFLSLKIAGTGAPYLQQASNSVLYAYMYSLANLFITLLSPIFGAVATPSAGQQGIKLSACSSLPSFSMMGVTTIMGV